jgi:hypothetical protein
LRRHAIARPALSKNSFEHAKKKEIELPFKDIEWIRIILGSGVFEVGFCLEKSLAFS